MFLDTRELHATVILQTGDHIRQTVSQLGLDFIGRSVGVVTIVHALLLHQIGHGRDVGQELVDNTVGTLHFKHTASHQAEGIDELLAETAVLEQINEQNYHLHTLVIILSVIVKRRFDGMAPGVEGIVEIETHKTETTVELAAIGLDIVVGPVIITDIEFDSHVIDKLIDIEQRLDFIIDFRLVVLQLPA